MTALAVALAAAVVLAPPAAVWWLLRREHGVLVGAFAAAIMGGGLWWALDATVDADLSAHRAAWHQEREPVDWGALDQRARRADLERVQGFLAHGRFVDGLREGPPVMAGALTLALLVGRLYRARLEVVAVQTGEE